MHYEASEIFLAQGNAASSPLFHTTTFPLLMLLLNRDHQHHLAQSGTGDVFPKVCCCNRYFAAQCLSCITVKWEKKLAWCGPELNKMNKMNIEFMSYIDDIQLYVCKMN